MELKAKVHKIATSGEETEVTFKLENYTGTLGIRNKKVTLPYKENPGWSKGEEVTIDIKADSI